MKVLAIIATVFLFIIPVHAKYSGGTGTPDDPYQIATAEDLIALGETPEDYDKHFILTADIDLNPSLPGRKVFDRAVIAPDTNNEKSGFQGTPFTGVFNCSGHTISHLTIKGVYYLGLFGHLGSGAKVSNLGLEDVDVNGIWGDVGGLVGYNWQGSITTSYSTGVVNGDYGVGCLVGDNRGSITDCHSTGNVSGRVWIGGLVGDNMGSITNCHSTGNVSGDSSIGGLAGRNLHGSVVSMSYTNGAVNGNTNVGGLVGKNHGGNITTSYSTITVNGNEYVGGFVGSNRNGNIAMSYSSGTVYGTGTYVGGLVGVNWSWNLIKPGTWGLEASGLSGSAGVWDKEVSGLSASAGGVGLTTAEMMDPYMLGLNGFANDPNWVLDAGRDYPRLAWEGTVGSAVPKPDIHWLDGGGTAEAPFYVNTAEQFILLGKAPIIWDKHFALSADIDLNPALPGRRVFVQPPIQYFTGVFDGNGHTISHLTISGIGSLGLFGRIASGAEVKDLGIVDVKVTGADSCGGLVGNNSGDLSYCYSNGVVTGDYGVGGLAGYNDGSITSNYSTCEVKGNGKVGGLVGGNDDGNITTSHSSGAVYGSERVGGLVGSNQGRVRGCDSSGDVGGGNNVGGIVGYNDYYGDVTHCASTSQVDGGSSVGGLVGHNHYFANVTCCYSMGTIDANNEVGGLVGFNKGATRNCYAMGPATGNRLVGGLVGCNRYKGTITNCYSAGMVTGTGSVGGLIGSSGAGQVTNSFWDIQRSGRTTSAGGTGKTTTQMQTAEIFLDAGWDFVDESENGKEDIWFIPEGQGYPELAWNFWAASPYPEDDATDVFHPLILTWVVGKYPLQHDVYFGDDKEAVDNATTETQGLFRGRQPKEMTLYDPGVLEYGKTYYWRIDEVNEANPHSPWKGRIWNFTTADFIFVLVVDDFESYDDYWTNIWQIWIDGFGDPDNGSQVGYLIPPYAETEIVHSGFQSMPLFYNNTGYITISEAVRTFNSPWDWTINDADTLTLYFCGEADNDPDSLYVGIEDSAGRTAVARHPAPDALLTTEWQKWHVSLVDMQAAGVDLTSVLKMYNGVGNRDNPQPGGTGKIYIDDIWLTNRMQ